MALDLSNTKALYVHIPFCDSICSYCDFCKVLSDTYSHMTYLKALEYELQQYPVDELETIYIGGGTPSCLTLEELKYLLDILKPYTKDVLEYSFEANPESLTLDKIQLLEDYHVNRVSLGVQTFNNDTLKLINRYHTRKDVFTCIQDLHNHHIDDINIDLIYGLPKNDLNQTLEDIQICDSLNISHISVYSLILEDHTVFKHLNYQPLSESDDALYYQSINTQLTKLNYIHYEVSAYYKKKPSLHNLKYWHYEDYLGIGLGAHSKVGAHTIENTRSMEKYLKHDFTLNHELLTTHDLMFNHLMMSLRLKEGISLTKFDDPLYKQVIEKYIHLGYMRIENNHLQLTYSGLMVMDTILLDFL